MVGSDSQGALGHGGVYDWLVQRKTALLMGLYCIYLFGFFGYNQPLTYALWLSLFQSITFKIITIIVLIALFRHTWIGVWTIATDYMHSFKVRTLFLLVCKIALFAYLVWGIYIIALV